MLPPSDSINHQSLKLAEFFASLRSSQNRLSSIPPPPPYAPSATSSSFPAMPAIEDSFADLEDDDDEATSLAPIMIKVDTSIEIEGQGNTIVIPTSNGGMGMGMPGDESTSPSPSPSPASSSSSSSSLQHLQQQRQVKSAQLASTIIAALKASGVLEEKESRRQRPIEVNVNAGIRIRGDRNVVCAGAGVRRRMGLSEDERGSAAVGGSGSGRKRRAGSQPVDMPSAKKPLV
ncbi:hypothetical protein FQN55_000412 [Onygenales sp. PD_40]|nr:hypothetical protein FQN55_000412 [Onygenales sp. PD_40]